MTESRFVNVSTNDPVCSFLWLSNIPLYICTTSPKHLIRGQDFYYKSIVHVTEFQMGSIAILGYQGSYWVFRTAALFGSPFYFLFLSINLFILIGG